MRRQSVTVSEHRQHDVGLEATRAQRSSLWPGCVVPSVIAYSNSSASERNSSPFPAPAVIGLVFGIHGSSCLFLSPSGLSPLNFPELPPSIPRGTQCVLLSSSASALAIRPAIGPWHPRLSHQISFMWGQNFEASHDRSLSLRPSGLLAILADQTVSCDRPTMASYFPTRWARITPRPVGYATAPN